MSGPSLRAYVCCAVILAAGVACSSATAPPPPGILIVAGGGQSDSVESIPAQALVIRLLAGPGQTAAHQVIQFRSVLNANGATEAFVMPISAPVPNTFVVDTTDGAGEASVQIQLGTVAGPAQVVVAAPVLGFVDTVSFTVLPGAATRIVATPADTAIYVNGTESVQASATDQFGNPRPGDAVGYAIASGPATLSGAVVTGTAIGRVEIIASAGKARDTIFASVVPQGTLAAVSSDTAIVMFNLDGSGFVTLARTLVTTVKWDPTGSKVVFNSASTNVGGGPGEGESLVTTSGVVSAADNPPVNYMDTWPAYSRDGMWIYFARYEIGQPEALWRIHPNGTGADSLQVNLVDNDYMPSPSPDGTQLAYVGSGNGVLRILTIATGAVFDPEIPGFSPAWSPNSDLIAYIASGGFDAPISVIHSNGTGARIIGSPSIGYGMGIDWSPDGKWVVAQRYSSGPLDLINVSSGLVLPLRFTAGLGSPAWRPGSSHRGNGSDNAPSTECSAAGSGETIAAGIGAGAAIIAAALKIPTWPPPRVGRLGRPHTSEKRAC